ncbi:hypothetical protein [Paenibacillus sp. B-A-8]|uniref:competence protein CoiA family protein n=1 Tax=Paenibacillus sp. B-A-8 TaxID=3400419 RepID=UPI003B02E988
MTDILYSLSLDEEGNMVHAKDANKKSKFFCLDCGNEMILRKSEKALRRPYFSHKAYVSNCTTESALYKGYKELLYKKINDALVNNNEINMIWKCEYCSGTHNANLIKKTKYIKKEQSFGICRPDISLLDSIGKLIIAIEIVVTHEPEEQVLKYYKGNNVVLIKIYVTEETDFDDLLLDFLTPNFVDVCMNPKCKKCGGLTVKKSLFIINGKCWRCKKPIKIAHVMSRFENYSVEDFSDKEIKLAFSLGVLVKKQYSQTVSYAYNAHVCNNSSSFLGQHFLYTEYLKPALQGRLKYVSRDIGYTCKNLH